MKLNSQFIKWTRLYIFTISFIILVTVFSILFDQPNIDFNFGTLLFLAYLLSSIRGIIALRSGEIPQYVTYFKIRILLDFCLVFWILFYSEYISDFFRTLISLIFSILFLLGPGIVVLLILQSSGKFGESEDIESITDKA